MIHTFNKHKPISAYIQVTWILIHVKEGIWDGMEGFGMGSVANFDNQTSLYLTFLFQLMFELRDPTLGPTYNSSYSRVVLDLIFSE